MKVNGELIKIIAPERGSNTEFNQLKWFKLIRGVVRILRNNAFEWQQNLVQFLSRYWSYPEITHVRIQIGDSNYFSNNFKKPSKGLLSPFKLNNGQSGLFEICCPENKHEPYEEEVFQFIREMICLAIDKQTASALHEKESSGRRNSRHSDDLAGRLIQAQEAERTRVARELHDNVNQQIAALSMDLSNVKKQLTGSEEIADEITSLQNRLSNIADEIRHVSHNLHSGVVQHAGLVMAARSICSEFASRNGVEVQFSTAGDIDKVPQDVALCIYRVVQEAIHNIQTHARAKHVRIGMVRSGSTLSLLISDDGCGFDHNDSSNQKGLGLLSMNERVQLVRGRIAIDSRKFQGTQILVDVPV